MLGLNHAFFEHLNLTIGTLALCTALIFLRYLLNEFREGRWTVKLWLSGKSMLRHQMAMAIGAICVGESIIRWWVWVARYLQTLGYDITWMHYWDEVPSLGLLFQAFGQLCAIRVFSPDEYGNRAWVACAVLVVLLNVLTSAVKNTLL